MTWQIFTVLVIQITYIYQPAATENHPVTRALKFRATVDDYIEFNPDMGPVKDAVAVCAWTKKLLAGSERTWFHYATDTRTYAIMISDAGGFNYIQNNYLDVSGSAAVPLGTWTHQCVTWSRSTETIRSYFNGTEEGSQSGARLATPLEVGGTLRIGRDYDGNVFGGELAKLNVFSKELTGAEVKKMHDDGMCSNVEENDYDTARSIKWEDILQKNRTGKVTEVDTGCSAPVEDEPTLECMPDKMIVTFASALETTDNFTLNGKTPVDSCIGRDDDNKKIEIEFGTNCNTSSNHNDTHIIFQNTLAKNPDTTSLINRGADIVLNLTCAYARNGTTTAQWTAQGQTTVDVGGGANYTFGMTAYADEDFNTTLSSPIKIAIGEMIYFQIDVEDVDTNMNLDFVTKHIVAVDTEEISSVNENEKHYIVQDGCAKDKTYNQLNSGQFSFKAFKFKDGNDKVYIHAVLRMCDDNDEECMTLDEAATVGCDAIEGAKRRDMELRDEDRSHDVSIYQGPFTFSDPKSTENGGYRCQVSALLIIVGAHRLLI